VKREITDEEIESMMQNWQHYVELKDQYLDQN
jgi:hypothetical protein